jgi:hypothetical protein
MFVPHMNRAGRALLTGAVLGGLVGLFACAPAAKPIPADPSGKQAPADERTSSPSSEKLATMLGHAFQGQADKPKPQDSLAKAAPAEVPVLSDPPAKAAPAEAPAPQEPVAKTPPAEGKAEPAAKTPPEKAAPPEPPAKAPPVEKKPEADPPADKPVLTSKQFDQIRALVKSTDEEPPWAKVNWVGTLWEAHEKAVKEGKPIAVLTTGGEPLGIC